MPHVVDFGRDATVQPVIEAVRLRHIDDCLRAGKEEGATHTGGDVAHELAAEAGDFVVVNGREAAEENRAEDIVADDLVDHTGDQERPSLA